MVALRRAVPALAWALAGAVALTGCGDPAPDDSSGEPARTEIPDDFPLASGMGGPADTVATSRSGTGLRDLTLCRSTPLRGLGLRDRMVADNSGGESADTRELVLLGSADEAGRVATTISDLASGCETPDRAGDTETLTEVRESPFGPAPASTLVQTWTVDGEPGDGATVVHVLPAGAALLVTSTYGQWTADELEEGVASTVEPLREATAALQMFDDGVGDPGADGSSVLRVTRVGSARLMVSTYGEASLASLDSPADQVTETTGRTVPAMCVFTKTGC